MFGIESATYTTLPLIIGAAAMMASTTRLSYSIVVLMLECSNAFNLAIPMIIAVFASKMVGDMLTIGIFERELRDANIPLLTGSVPLESRFKKAC